MSMAEISCFQRHRTLFKVAVLPHHSTNPMEAVKTQLNHLLFKYDEKLAGVPLAFGDLSFPPGKDYARILIDQPWLHIDVITDLIVFQPIVGTKLRAKISSITDNHISALVYAMFNVSISAASMVKSCRFDKATQQWRSKTDGSVVSIGDVIEFVVIAVQHSSGVINIEGSV